MQSCVTKSELFTLAGYLYSLRYYLLPTSLIIFLAALSVIIYFLYVEYKI
jgi:hypothetical protein